MLVALFLIPCGMGRNIDFEANQMTLPQVMEALQRVSSDDSDFKTMTYTLPRVYHNQGAKISGSYQNIPEAELRTLVILDLCKTHRLVFEERPDNHHRFVREIDSNVSAPFTLSEALAALQKYIKQSDLDLKDWEIVHAELKLESTPNNTGKYWHFQYQRNHGTDGGVGTYHFFVWSDLLVEHHADGKGRSIPMISTDEIIKTMSAPGF